jgi:hypothetical protein
MTIATHALDHAAPVAAQTTLGFKIAGIAFAAVVPALFWVALFAGAASLAGVTVAASALVLPGAAVTLFLTAVCAPIMLKA